VYRIFVLFVILQAGFCKHFTVFLLHLEIVTVLLNVVWSYASIQHTVFLVLVVTVYEKFISFFSALSALTLVGQQEGHPACKS